MIDPKQRGGSIGQWIARICFGEFHDDPEFLKFKRELPAHLQIQANAIWKEIKKNEAEKSRFEIPPDAKTERPLRPPQIAEQVPPPNNSWNRQKTFPFLTEFIAVVFLMAGVWLAADSLNFVTYTNGFVQFAGVTPIKAALSAGCIAISALLFIRALRPCPDSSASVKSHD